MAELIGAGVCAGAMTAVETTAKHTLVAHLSAIIGWPPSFAAGTKWQLRVSVRRNLAWVKKFLDFLAHGLRRPAQRSKQQSFSFHIKPLEPQQHSRATLFGQRMMVKAERAGYLPDSVLVLPESNELRFSDVRTVSGVIEAMNTDFYRSVLRNRIHFQRSGN
jgi:hypothetical protein